MVRSTSQRIVLSGLLVAVGILLPFTTSHAFGVPGTVLLPMHIPVFLIGLLCGPLYGAIGGVIIPALSSMLTGMPPVFPMLPIMTGELLVYGLVSGLLYRNAKMPLYPSLIGAMIGGRAVYGLIFAVLLALNSGGIRALSVTGALIQGLPGIAIQLTLIPAIVVAANRHYRNASRQEAVVESEALSSAKRMIADGKATCLVIKDDSIVHSAIGPGVAPLIALYENRPDVLKGGLVVDKVIGKAAAMIVVLGGASGVYGVVMSQTALSFLRGRGVPAGYGRCVNVISNRTGDGLCPLEKSIMDVDQPELAYPLLKATIRKLMKAG